MANHKTKTFSFQQIFSDWEHLLKENKKYSKGSYLYQLNSAIDRIIFLKQGRVHLSYYNEAGGIYQVAEVSAPIMLGEVEFILSLPALTEAVAVTDLECIEISLSANRQLLEKDLLFSRYLNLQLAQKLTHVNQNNSNRTLKTVEELLMEYLLQLQEQKIFKLRNLKSVSHQLPCSYRQLLRVVKLFVEKGVLIPGERRGVYYLNSLSSL